MTSWQIQQDTERWSRAAEAGDVNAVSHLGDLAYFGVAARELLERLCGEAADRGDIVAMERLRRQVLRGLRDRPGGGISYETQDRELQRWYGRAAAAGSLDAIIHLARFHDRNGRPDEAIRWLTEASEAGSTEAMVDLARLQEGLDLVDEAERWLRRSIDDGSLDAMIALAQLLDRQGRSEEATAWLVTALEDGSPDAEWIMMRLAELRERRGRPDEAEQWLRSAISDGSVHAMLPLAGVLERAGRDDEAELWLHRAMDAGWTASYRRLGEMLARQGRTTEAERWLRHADAAEAPRGPPADWGTVVMTAAVTAAVVPFIQTLASKAAEDSYAAARAFIRRLLREHGKRTREAEGASGTHLVVKDPDLGIVLRLRPDVSDEALSALAELELDHGVSRASEGRVLRLAWNDARRAWELADADHD